MRQLQAMPDLRPLTSTAPPLMTARLRLEGHVLAALDEYAAMWADPAVVRFIGGRPLAPEEVWTRILGYIGHWATLGYGFWAIREATTGRFVGQIGLADFRRSLQPSFGQTPEIGWALCPWAHNQGFASEALERVLTWADERFPGERIVCMIHPQNQPSIKLARRHGFHPFAQTLYREMPTTLFERLPPAQKTPPAPSAHTAV